MRALLPTVVLANAQGIEHRRVSSIAHHGVGHQVGHTLHPIPVRVHGQHVMAYFKQLSGHRRSKSAQAKHCKILHVNSSINRS